MRLRQLVVSSLTACLLTVLAGTASALTPYPFENDTDVPDGRSAPFVGHWSVRVAGRTGGTISTCAIPLEIEASGPRSIVYRAPNDPEARIDLIAEDRRTTWQSSITGGSFIAVWTDQDRFYLYDQAAPDLGGPYSFARCN